MPERLDSRIYQQALAILRDNHKEEFEHIRYELFDKQGVQSYSNPFMDLTKEEFENKLVSLIWKHQVEKDKPASFTWLARRTEVSGSTIKRALLSMHYAGRVVVNGRTAALPSE